MNSNDLKTISQRLREYIRNPHHIDAVSEGFKSLIDEAASALSKAAEQPAPADKGQGEPVAYLDENYKFVFVGYEKLRTACWVDANDRAIPHAWKPLYAEKPAPTTGYTAVDMSTAAAQGFRDGQAAALVMPELVPTFEAWWESDGQYCRAGGGDYEKTFAYRAYENALAEIARLNSEPKP